MTKKTKKSNQYSGAWTPVDPPDHAWFDHQMFALGGLFGVLLWTIYLVLKNIL